MAEVLFVSKPVAPPWNDSSKNLVRDIAGHLQRHSPVLMGHPGQASPIDRGRIERETQVLLDQVGLSCPPGTIVSDLSLGHQQLVEIAKALSVKARIIIMDEPTSSLTQPESKRLFGVIRKVRKQGVSVIYISHRLGEVKELSDRVCVLRDGRNSGELERGKIDHDGMIRLMVGRDLAHLKERRRRMPGKPVLVADSLRTPAHPGATPSCWRTYVPFRTLQ